MTMLVMIMEVLSLQGSDRGLKVWEMSYVTILRVTGDVCDPVVFPQLKVWR
jgi:hypothetical protein